MSGSEQERGKAVSERLLEAINAHDLEGQLACFNEDYRSEQPAHPARAFSGREQVRENWSKLYESIPDFRAELLRLAVAGEAEWGEWIWRGTKEDGTPLEERGVTIMGIRDGQIAWGRLYLEETEREGADITETVRRMAGREESLGTRSPGPQPIVRGTHMPDGVRLIGAGVGGQQPTGESSR
jgi:ketosteroid isomerase-like protein